MASNSVLFSTAQLESNIKKLKGQEEVISIHDQYQKNLVPLFGIVFSIGVILTLSLVYIGGYFGY